MRNWIQFLTGVGLILLSQSYGVPQEVEAVKPGRPLVTQVGENNYRITWHLENKYRGNMNIFKGP